MLKAGGGCKFPELTWLGEDDRTVRGVSRQGTGRPGGGGGGGGENWGVSPYAEEGQMLDLVSKLKMMRVADLRIVQRRSR